MKPSTSTNVIAKRGSSALGIPSGMSRGARGLLATPAGEVTCELEAIAIDADGARYELRVTNGTTGTLGATAYAVRVEEGRPVAALAVEIPPQQSVRTGFVLDPRLPYERVAAEVRGEGIHLVVEAAPPRRPAPRRRWLVPAAALGGAAALAGGVLLAYAAARPAVVSAALVASPGGDLIAQWSTRGSTAPTYALLDARGNVRARGTLPAANGTLSLGRGDAATLHVAVANAFGSDSRDAAYARATPPPAIRIVTTPPPRIARISIDAPRPGQPLTVRYAADRTAHVRLAIVDRNGSSWFATTVAPGSGEARVPAPPADGRQPYALVASAGVAGDETRVPVPTAVTPAPVPSASATPRAVETPGPVADPNDVSGGDLIVAPDVVQPGQTVAVQLPYADGGRLAIVRDADGAEVAGVTVPRNVRRVTLNVPRQGSGPYSVRATIDRGIGSVTLLHHLTLIRKR